MAQFLSWGFGNGGASETDYVFLPGDATLVGGSLPFIIQDANDSTEVRWSSQSIFGYRVVDTRIPANSTSLTAGLSVRWSTNIPNGDYYLAKYTSATVNIGALSGSGPSTDSATATTDGNGSTLTPANWSNTYWGAYANGGGTYTFRVKELSISLTFTLPVPTFTTNPATGISSNQATLNGVVNPNSATSTYPVTYYFEWGLTTAFGNTTSSAQLTGSANNSVSANIVGLSAGSSYYFRVRGSTADGTFVGATQNFTAGTAVISGRRQYASL